MAGNATNPVNNALKDALPKAIKGQGAGSASSTDQPLNLDDLRFQFANIDREEKGLPLINHFSELK